MKYILIFIKYFVIFILVFLLASFFYSLYLKNTKTPKQNADWELGQEKMAQVIFDDQRIEIKNLRDFNWSEQKDAEKIN